MIEKSRICPHKTHIEVVCENTHNHPKKNRRENASKVSPTSNQLAMLISTTKAVYSITSKKSVCSTRRPQRKEYLQLEKSKSSRRDVQFEIVSSS